MYMWLTAYCLVPIGCLLVLVAYCFLPSTFTRPHGAISAEAFLEMRTVSSWSFPPARCHVPRAPVFAYLQSNRRDNSKGNTPNLIETPTWNKIVLLYSTLHLSNVVVCFEFRNGDVVQNANKK